MRHNHFSMLPEHAFQPRPFGGMTLEGGLFGGGGGGGGGGDAPPPPTRPTNPNPVAPYVSAGGGFMGRGAPTTPNILESQFDTSYYLKQNPDVARDPYYGGNPFHHYQDFGFTERRSPFEGFQYLPSQQPMYNPYFANRSSRPDLVSDAYSRIAQRAPDEEGFNYWTGEMMKGLTGQGLVGGFTSNPEFQRQQDYQRAYTEAFRPGYKEFGPSGQYYQPIYQSSYSRYQQPSQFYRPSYSGPSFSNPFNYGGGGFGRSMYFNEGGDVAEDEGIAALRNA